MNLLLVMSFLRTQHWAVHVPITVFIAHPHMDYLMAIMLPVIFCQQAFLFAVNDYFDREVDAKDPDKVNRNVISSGALSLKNARIMLALTIIIPVFLCSFLGLIPFIVNIIWLIIAAFYTAPPIRFKKRVGFDLLIHGITVFSFPYLFALIVTEDYTTYKIIVGIMFICISIFSQIIQEARDYETDLLIESNSVITLGLPISLGLMLILLTISIVLASFLIITHQANIFLAICSTICLCWIYDILLTLRSGKLTEVAFNCFDGLFRKGGLCSIPIIIVWLLS